MDADLKKYGCIFKGKLLLFSLDQAVTDLIKTLYYKVFTKSVYIIQIMILFKETMHFYK